MIRKDGQSKCFNKIAVLLKLSKIKPWPWIKQSRKEFIIRLSTCKPLFLRSWMLVVPACRPVSDAPGRGTGSSCLVTTSTSSKGRELNQWGVWRPGVSRPSSDLILFRSVVSWSRELVGHRPRGWAVTWRMPTSSFPEIQPKLLGCQSGKAEGRASDFTFTWTTWPRMGLGEN